METLDAERDEFRVASATNGLPDIVPNSLQLDLSNIAKSLKAWGFSPEEIPGLANQLLHGCKIRAAQTADPLLSILYFLKDPRAMMETYVKYRDLVLSALGAVLQEPGLLINFLSVFVQPSNKHLQRLLAN